MKEPQTQIAVTLFNLRDFCQTESDLDRTLARVRGMGYEAVQVSGTPVEASIIRRLLEKNGLFCCATHENLDMIKDTHRFIDRLHTIGCDFAALGWPPVEFHCEEGFKKLAALMDEQGEKFAAEGIRLGYHNHHFEFQHGSDGKCFLENFYDLTTPGKVFAEIDVHWVTRGGGSPVRWIEKVKGRMPVVHFKDFVVTDDSGTPAFCEIGCGNLDWPSIIDACRRTGVRWYSIEQDQPFQERDIFESIEISLKNLHAMGVK